MNVSSIIKSALDAIDNPLAQSIISPALKAINPDIANGVQMATFVAPAAFNLLQAFTEGSISADELRDGWNKQLAHGAVADAVVALGAAQRKAGGG